MTDTGTAPAMTTEKALARAVFWLSALIAEGEIDPEDTEIKVTAKKGGAVAYEETIHLGDDLRVFASLGVATDIFDVEEA